MKTLQFVVSTRFLVLLGILAVPRYLLAQADAAVPPADYTGGESNICEVHNIEIFKRTVPFAHGMIPMSRAEAHRGEWKRRTDNYPHPGDVQPATGIVLPGQKGRCVVFACPKCEAAKRAMERDDAAVAERLSRAIDPAILAKIEHELGRWEKAAKDEALADGSPPSRQTAYFLLAGLAAQGRVIEGLSEPEQRLFDVENRGGVRAKLMSVFAHVRVALVDQEIQDKSGSYVRQRAVLYVQRDGKWVRGGTGAITAPGISDP